MPITWTLVILLAGGTPAHGAGAATFETGLTFPTFAECLASKETLQSEVSQENGRRLRDGKQQVNEPWHLLNDAVCLPTARRSWWPW